MKPPTGKRANHSTKKFRAQLRQFISHLRKDVAKGAEPKAKALFETSAEVLTGLAKAFTDYEKKHEKAWRAGRRAPRAKPGATRASKHKTSATEKQKRQKAPGESR